MAPLVVNVYYSNATSAIWRSVIETNHFKSLGTRTKRAKTGGVWRYGDMDQPAYRDGIPLGRRQSNAPARFVLGGALQEGPREEIPHVVLLPTSHRLRKFLTSQANDEQERQQSRNPAIIALVKTGGRMRNA